KENNTAINSDMFGKALLGVATEYSQQEMKVTNILYNSLDSINTLYEKEKELQGIGGKVGDWLSLGNKSSSYEQRLEAHKSFFDQSINKIANSSSFMDAEISQVITDYENGSGAIVDQELRIKDLPAFGYRDVTVLEQAFKGNQRDTIINYCISTGVETLGLVAISVLTAPLSGGSSVVVGGAKATSTLSKFYSVVKGLNIGMRINRAANMALAAGGLMSIVRVGSHNISEIIKGNELTFLEDIALPAAEGFNQGKWIGAFMGGVGGMTLSGEAGLGTMLRAGLQEKILSKVFVNFLAGTGVRFTYGVSKEYFVEGKDFADINYQDIAGDSVAFGVETAVLLTLGKTMSAGATAEKNFIMQKASKANIAESEIIGKTAFGGIKTYGQNLLLKGDAIEALAARSILAERMFSTANVLLKFNMFGKAFITPFTDAYLASKGKEADDSYVYKMLAGFGEGGALESWTQGGWFGVPFAFLSKASAVAETAFANMTKDWSIGRFIGKLKMNAFDRLPKPVQYFTGGTIKEAFIEGPIAGALTNLGLPSYIAETLVEFIPGGGPNQANVFSETANISTVEAFDRNAALNMAANTQLSMITSPDVQVEIAKTAGVEVSELANMSVLEWIRKSDVNSQENYSVAKAFNIISGGNVSTVADVAYSVGQSEKKLAQSLGFEVASMGHASMNTEVLIKEGGQQTEDAVMNFTGAEVAWIQGKTLDEIGLVQKYSEKTLKEIATDAGFSFSEVRQYTGADTVTVTQWSGLERFKGKDTVEVVQKHFHLERYNSLTIYSATSFKEFMLSSGIITDISSINNKQRYNALQELGIITTSDTQQALNQLQQISTELEKEKETTLDNASLEDIAEVKGIDLATGLKNSNKYQYHKINAARVELIGDNQVKMQIGDKKQVMSINNFNKALRDMSAIPYAMLDVGTGASKRKIDISRMNTSAAIRTDQNRNSELVITLLDSSVTDLDKAGLNANTEIRINADNNASVLFASNDNQYYKVGKKEMVINGEKVEIDQVSFVSNTDMSSDDIQAGLEKQNYINDTIQEMYAYSKEGFTPKTLEGVNQVEAVLNMIINPNTLFRIPTGTGKTYFMFSAIARINQKMGKKTVFVVHDLNQFAIQAENEGRAELFKELGIEWTTISNKAENLAGEKHFSLNDLEHNKEGVAESLQKSDVVIMSADVFSFFENALGKETGTKSTHVQNTWNKIFGNGNMLLFDEADTIFFKQRAQSGEGAKQLTTEQKTVQRAVHYHFLGDTLGLWGNIENINLTQDERAELQKNGYINE
ncbi:MAG: DEAD/DEAH box helicase family protein, partial [Candidatus Pacebacteria bacterium]|nr:DEAD/DEAH box helicase family protein [Candidatus Paceibacterota bacterium]